MNTAARDRTGRGASSDERLMAQLQAGDVDAFAALYDRFAARAYQIARSVCRDDGRAEDAVQEAFKSIWHSRASYRPDRGTLAAWLVTVVRHRAIDLSRRNGTQVAQPTADDAITRLPAHDDVAAQSADRAQARRLRDALARLPDAQREVITLAFYGQLTHTEIVGCPVSLRPGPQARSMTSHGSQRARESRAWRSRKTVRAALMSPRASGGCRQSCDTAAAGSRARR